MFYVYVLENIDEMDNFLRQCKHSELKQERLKKKNPY